MKSRNVRIQARSISAPSFASLDASLSSLKSSISALSAPTPAPASAAAPAPAPPPSAQRSSPPPPRADAPARRPIRNEPFAPAIAATSASTASPSTQASGFAFESTPSLPSTRPASLLGRSASMVLSAQSISSNASSSFHAATAATATTAAVRRAPVASAGVRRKSMRPSFSDQLLAATAKASEVLHDLHRLTGNAAASLASPVHIGSNVLLECPTNALIVGKLTSKYPSVVQFYSDVCTYKFWHPFEAKEITMIMNFGDMSNVVLTRRKFTFKINHVLSQFGRDYQPSILSHGLTIELASDVDARSFREIILPRVHMHAEK